MANMQAINATLEYIRKHFDLWDQTTWASVVEDDTIDKSTLAQMLLEDPYNPVCNTTGCMAGLAVGNAGYKPVFNNVRDGFYPYIGAAELCVKVEKGSDGKYKAVGEPVSIKGKAAELFDIDFKTATRLFDSDNTYEDLLSAVRHLEERGSLTTWIRPSDDNGDFDDESYDDDYEDNDDEWCSACGSSHSGY